MGVDRLKRPRSVFFVLAASLALVTPFSTAYAFTQSQAHAGARTYKRQCARCHGRDASGKDNQYKGLRAPKLVGAGALPCQPRPYQKIRKNTFRTLKGVYDFVSASMPADQPAILDADEYWDVLAYLLQLNGRAADATPLDAAAAARIVLHPDCASSGGP